MILQEERDALGKLKRLSLDPVCLPSSKADESALGNSDEEGLNQQGMSIGAAPGFRFGAALGRVRGEASLGSLMIAFAPTVLYLYVCLSLRLIRLIQDYLPNRW